MLLNDKVALITGAGSGIKVRVAGRHETSGRPL